MEITNPELVIFDRAQTGTVTVTVASSTDISAWNVAATLQTSLGADATVIATKTVGSGITSAYAGGTQTWVITWSATDLNQTPGGYVWQFRRTDSGAEYQIVEPSGFVIRGNAAAGGPTLTNLSEYVTHALNSATLRDPQAKQLIQLLFAAEGHIKRWCNRDFVYRASVTEYYDGTGTPNLVLRRTPVASIGSVRLDYTGNAGSTADSFGTDTALTSGEDWYLEIDSPYGDGLSYAGILKRIDGTWPLRSRRPQGLLAAGTEPLPGCIRVVYTAGFQLIPYDLKRAVWDLTTYMSEASLFGRIPQSESGEGYSRSFGSWDDDMKAIGSVANVLQTYQRLYPG